MIFEVSFPAPKPLRFTFHHVALALRRSLPPEGGIGVRGFRPCERRKCTFARCLHGLSPSPEGLFFSAQPLNFPFVSSPVIPTAFVGSNKSGRILPYIPPCYHFGAIRYQFFGKDRLSGQIAIRFLGRQTGRGKKIAIQPVSLSFPAQSISKPG